MLEIDIPGYKTLRLEHLLLDYNGTLAYDGELLDGVDVDLSQLSHNLHIHILTGDTFGRAREELSGIPCELVILSAYNQDSAKLDYLQRLGAKNCAAIGNGRNDRLMLKTAELAIAVAQHESVAVEALMAADILVPNIGAALGLLLHPLRLMATLRS